nr:PQQ-binding-like beta-propeller repeat protein [Streptomyces sp. GbtcB6]
MRSGRAGDAHPRGFQLRRGGRRPGLRFLPPRLLVCGGRRHGKQAGGKRWELPFSGSTWSTPAVVDGTVYMGSNGWYLWAVDAATGEERWKQETGAARQSSPAVADGTVYVGSLDDFLYAIHT